MRTVLLMMRSVDHTCNQFDQAIQAGLDAPHLGVGITAGEPAAYESFKDIMDVVIEGWHGYKPTDTHKYGLEYFFVENLNYYTELTDQTWMLLI